MTPMEKRERARRIREVAGWFEPAVAQTMLELADTLDEEAAAQEQPRDEPPLQAT
jgi:hypothetical protein